MNIFFPSNRDREPNKLKKNKYIEKQWVKINGTEWNEARLF
jgi:hypothetical protein